VTARALLKAVFIVAILVVAAVFEAKRVFIVTILVVAVPARALLRAVFIVAILVVAVPAGALLRAVFIIIEAVTAVFTAMAPMFRGALIDVRITTFTKTVTSTVATWSSTR